MTALAEIDALTWVRIAVRAAAYAASLLAAGSALFLVTLRPDAETARATRRLAVAAALSGVGLAAGVVFGEALFLVGGDAAAALDPLLLGVVTESPVGAQQAARALGLALIATLAVGPAGRAPAALGALAVAASFAFAGHTLRDPRAALAVTVTLHVAAAAWWLGGFAPLRRAARHAPPPEAARLAQAFGRGALGVVALLVAAGVGLLVLIAGSPLAALETGWGRLLALKLVAVVGLLALAALNKLRLAPALAADRPGAGRALRRSIAAEAALALAILLATAAMTTLGGPPGAEG
ncbi:MAG: CopD family protein [Paracoccaceae bacterium]